MDLKSLEKMMDPRMQAMALKMQNKGKAVDAAYSLAGNIVARSVTSRHLDVKRDSTNIAGIVTAIAKALSPVLLQDFNKAVDEATAEAELASAQTPSIS